MAYLTLVSSGETSLQFRVDDLNPDSTYTEVYITCNGQTSSNLAPPSSGYTYSYSYTFENLSCGTTYSATYSLTTAFGSTGSGSGTGATSACPLPSPGGVGTVYATPDVNSVYLTWSSASYAEYYAVEYRLYGTSSWTGVNYNITGTSYTVTGLSEGTYYDFKVYARNSSGNGTPSYTTAQTKKSRPSNFSWTYSKTSGNTFNLYASEWNSLQSKVNEFRQYKGLANYSFTSASSGGIFYAYMFNQVRNAINEIPGKSTSPPSTQSSGNDIYASYLNGLVDSLNSTS